MRASRPLQHRGGGGVAVGDQRVASPSSSRSIGRGGSAGGRERRDARQISRTIAAARSGPAYLRGPQRRRGRSRAQLEVERLERAARLSSSGGASPAEPEANATGPRSQLDAGALELVERTCLGSRQQRRARRRTRRPEARLRRRQRRSARRAGSAVSVDGALQERRRGGEPAASLRPAGRALELGGDILVGSRRRAGAVPGAPIRVASRRRWPRRGRRCTRWRSSAVAER